MQQTASDQIIQFLHTQMRERGDVDDIIKQMKKLAVKKALAEAALKQLIKRNAACMYNDDASTLASQPEAGAEKRRVFPILTSTPTPSVPGLKATDVTPSLKIQMKENFCLAATNLSLMQPGQQYHGMTLVSIQLPQQCCTQQGSGYHTTHMFTCCCHSNHNI